mmetsp:Transcript_59300/g.109598  ORF Transcript_59300/g.109598 Transcript_59300/m.109598 type:complete len:721 (-) Transcript_59300:71-2233(-)
MSASPYAPNPVGKLQGRPASVGEFSGRHQFQLVKELHNSSFGSVHLARVRERSGVQRRAACPSLVILKRRQVAELGKAKDMLNEYEVLKKLNHPNIIQCYGYFWDNDTQSVYLVLEYAQCGDLHAELQARRKAGRPFSDAEVCDIAAQIVAGLAHIHAKGIVHRDIKSLNLLLTDSGMVKLGDFGVSRQMSESTLCLNSFYGTPLYLSPELIEGKPYSDTTDVWSLGVVLYEVLALHPPFDGRSLQDVVNTVLRGRYSPLPSSRPAEFTHLVQDMLTKEPHRRPKIGVVAQKLSRVQKLYGSKSGSALSSESGGRTPSGGSDWRPASASSWGVEASPIVSTAAVDSRTIDGRGMAAEPSKGSQVCAAAPAPAQVVDADPRCQQRPQSMPVGRAAGRPSRPEQQQRQSGKAGPASQDEGRGSVVEVVRVRRKSSTSASQAVAEPEIVTPVTSPAAPPREPVHDDIDQDVLVRPAQGVSVRDAPRWEDGPLRAPPGVSVRDARWEERRRAHEERQGRQENVMRVTHRDAAAAGPGAPPGAPPATGPVRESAPPRMPGPHAIPRSAAQNRAALGPTAYAGCVNGGCACAYPACHEPSHGYPARYESPHPRVAAGYPAPYAGLGLGCDRQPADGSPSNGRQPMQVGAAYRRQERRDGENQRQGNAARRAASEGAPAGRCPASGHHAGRYPWSADYPQAQIPQQRKHAAGVPPRYDIVANRWVDN